MNYLIEKLGYVWSVKLEQFNKLSIYQSFLYSNQ